MDIYDKNGQYVRTYTEQMHGENYKKMAIGFAKKIGGRIGAIIVDTRDAYEKIETPQHTVTGTPDPDPVKVESDTTAVDSTLKTPMMSTTTAPFCTQCTSKGGRHLKVCSTNQLNK